MTESIPRLESAAWLLSAFLTMGAVVALVVGRYAETATVQGVLESKVPATTLVSPISGVVKEIRFVDGASVKAGDVLFVLDGREYNRAGVSLSRVDSEALELQVGIIERQRGLAISALDELVHLQVMDSAAIREDLIRRLGLLALRRSEEQLVTERLAAMKVMAGSDLVAKHQLAEHSLRVLEKKVARKSVEGEVAKLEAQLKQLEITHKIDRLQLSEKIEALNLRLAEVSALIERHASYGLVSVVAPVSGSFSTLGVDLGATVSAGEHLSSIVTAGAELYAKLLVDSASIGVAQKAKKVILKIDAFPYQRFGVVEGEIHSISARAGRVSGFDSQAQGYFAYVEIEGPETDVSESGFSLRPGMTLVAELAGEPMSLLDWVFRPLAVN